VTNLPGLEAVNSSLGNFQRPGATEDDGALVTTNRARTLGTERTCQAREDSCSLVWLPRSTDGIASRVSLPIRKTPYMARGQTRYALHDTLAKDLGKRRLVALNKFSATRRASRQANPPFETWRLGPWPVVETLRGHAMPRQPGPDALLCTTQERTAPEG